MKKKYTPAELEIIMASVCDVIASSQEIGGGDNGDNGGTGEGGGWNDEGWM